MLKLNLQVLLLVILLLSAPGVRSGPGPGSHPSSRFGSNPSSWFESTIVQDSVAFIEDTVADSARDFSQIYTGWVNSSFIYPYYLKGSTIVNDLYGSVNRTGLILAGAALVGVSGLAFLSELNAIPNVDGVANSVKNVQSFMDGMISRLQGSIKSSVGSLGNFKPTGLDSIDLTDRADVVYSLPGPPYNYDLDSVLNLTASADRKTDQSSQEIVSIDKYFQQEIDEKVKKFFEKEKMKPETEMSSVNNFEETLLSPLSDIIETNEVQNQFDYDNGFKVSSIEIPNTVNINSFTDYQDFQKNDQEYWEDPFQPSKPIENENEVNQDLNFYNLLHQTEKIESFDSVDFGNNDINNFVENPFKKYKNPFKYQKPPDFSLSKTKYHQEFPMTKYVKNFKPKKPDKYFEMYHQKPLKHFHSRPKYFKSKKYFEPKKKYLSETGRNHYGNGKRRFQSEFQNFPEHPINPQNSLKMKPFHRIPLQNHINHLKKPQNHKKNTFETY